MFERLSPYRRTPGCNASTVTTALGMASQFSEIFRLKIVKPFFQSIGLFRGILYAGIYTPSTFYHIECDINGSLDTQRHGNGITWAGVNVKLFTLQGQRNRRVERTVSQVIHDDTRHRSIYTFEDIFNEVVRHGARGWD